MMKYKKLSRLISLLLAVVFALGLGTPVMASGRTVISPQAAAAAEKVDLGASDRLNLQLSSQQFDALRFLENREVGLLGFTGAYSLENYSGDELITVIVEFKNAPATVASLMSKVKGRSLSQAAARQLADADQTSFQRDIAKLAPSYKILHTYDEALNGVAVRLPASKVESLLALDSVLSVYPNTTLFTEPGSAYEPLYGMHDVEGEHVGMSSSREIMNVNALHDEGITGEGVTVIVLDSGVDYNHPDMQDAFKTTLPAGAAADTTLSKFNGKYYGRNFITTTDYLGNPVTARDPFNPMETTYDEWVNYQGTRPAEVVNGKSYYTNHGTHVSGIIAAQGVNTTISSLGIAPDCQLLVYRVLGPYGSGSNDQILAAINETGRDGADVVNMSLGGSSNYPNSADSIAVNNMILQYDIVFCLSAGNSGPNLSTTTNPGSSSLAITVGAAGAAYENYILTTDTGHQIYAFYKDIESGMVENGDGTVTSTYPLLTADAQHRYTFVPLDPDADGLPRGTGIAADFTAAGAAVKGNIAVVMRGNAFLDTMANAVAAGAGGVLVINSATGGPSEIIDYRGVGSSYLPTWTAPYYDQGVAFMKALKANGYVCSFTAREGLEPTLADFSSRGPIDDTYDIKPDIVGHGQGVLSLCPWYVVGTDNTGPDKYEYAYLSENGTSMASPCVAGVAALLRGYSKENGLNWQASEIKARLMNTANPIPVSDYSVYEIGAGYADAYRALHADFYATVPYDHVLTSSNGSVTSGELASLNFGPAALVEGSFSRSLQVVLHNDSASSKTVSLAHIFNSEGQGVLNMPAATLTHPAQETIAAGQTKTIDVTLHIPATEDKGSVEGYLVIQDNDEVYRLPFAASTPHAKTLLDAFVGRPALASPNGSSRHLVNQDNNSSELTDFYFEWAGNNPEDFSMMGYVVRDANRELLGQLDSVLPLDFSLPAGGYRLNGLHRGFYWPYMANGGLGTRPAEFTEGLYYIECMAIYADSSGYESILMPMYIDDTPPELTLDNAEDTNIYYTGDSLTLTGNVFDEATALLEDMAFEFPLTYDVYTQAFNGLVFVYGTAIYLVPVEDDGSFSVMLQNVSGTKTLDVYVFDHFVPTLVPSGARYTMLFDVTMPSFAMYQGSSIFAFYGANMIKRSYTVAREGTGDNVKITSVTLTPESLLETLASAVNIRIEGTGFDTAVAYLEVGGADLYRTELTDGVGRMVIDKAPAAGTYDLIVEAESEGGWASHTSELTVQPYNKNMWTFTPERGSDGYLYLQFEARAVSTAGTVLTIGGSVCQLVSASETDGRGTRFKTDKLAAECMGLTKITVDGLSLPDFYQPEITFRFSNTYTP